MYYISPKKNKKVAEFHIIPVMSFYKANGNIRKRVYCVYLTFAWLCWGIAFQVYTKSKKFKKPFHTS